MNWLIALAVLFLLLDAAILVVLVLIYVQLPRQNHKQATHGTLTIKERGTDSQSQS